MMIQAKNQNPLLIPLLLILIALPACVTQVKILRPDISGDPCANADWFEVGRLDGLNGVAPENSVYVGRCESRGQKRDESLYSAGWNRGLIDYCTPERGFDAGRAEEEYSGICPSHLEAAFLRRYRVGKDVSRIERENAAIDSQLNQKLAESEGTILGDAISRLPGIGELQPNDDKKKQLAAEIQGLRDQRARNDVQIRELESL